GNVRIIDAAKPPKSPVKPKKKLNLMMGFFIGLGLGIGIVFLLEHLDSSVRTIEEVESFGLPLLAAIGAFAALITECTIEVEKVDES
ncbi:MAG: hypothetical protein JSU58_08860, partial [Dehalococcoidales bacterium]